MPIPVTCPSCEARFQVSDKFAGQTGPCPKCKKPIVVPAKTEEVVIHAPEEFGPKDTVGRAVLKPIEREETAASPVFISGIVAAAFACVVVAFFLGRSYKESPDQFPMAFLAAGAVLLGPLLAAGAYGLFRDAELQPYRGVPLWIRSILCGLVYAALWGALWFVKNNLFNGEPLEMPQLVFIIPAMIGAGAVAPLATLDLDYTSGALHYAVYLATTCLLRLLMGLSLF